MGVCADLMGSLSCEQSQCRTPRKSVFSCLNFEYGFLVLSGEEFIKRSC